ncbi:MAG: peptidoglycan-binding protein [Chromatiales bacterium]|nr:peptidoglycan-binding protein [Chromatiales bacterium]
MNSPIRAIFAATLCFCAPFSHATAPHCGPSDYFAKGSELSFHVDDNPAGFALIGRLAADTTIAAKPSDFGLGESEAEPRRSTQDALIDSVALSPSDLAGGALALQRPGYTPPYLIARHGDQRYRIAVSTPDPARPDAATVLHSDLLLVPSKATTDGLHFPPFVIPEDSVVRLPLANPPVLPKGTQLILRPTADKPVRVRLNAPANLPIAPIGNADAVVRFDGAGRAAAGHEVTLNILQPGADLGAATIHVCLSTTAGRDAPRRFYALAGTPLGSPGEVTDNLNYQITIPAALGELADHWGGTLGHPARLHVTAISADGKQVLAAQQIDFEIANTTLSTLLSVLVVIVILIGFGVLLGTFNPVRIVRSLCSGKTGRLSLSNVQIFMWTALVIFAMLFVWITQGQIINLPEGILVLLGISGGTSILARAVAIATGSSLPTTPPTATPSGTAGLDNLYRDADGEVDLLRFQMLGFTVFTWLYVLNGVITTSYFPNIPENLYWLMGISSATYVGGKLRFNARRSTASDTPPAVEQAADPATAGDTFVPSAEQIKQVQKKLGVAETGVQDAATLAAIKAFETRRGALPTDGRLSEPLMDAILNE